MHDFPRVQFFSTKFLYARLSVGCFFARKLEGGEQRIFPVNAFVFLSIEMAYFFGTKLRIHDRVNTLLRNQKFFPRKENTVIITNKLTGVKSLK